MRVGLIVNDSGIVAAATTSIYIIAPVPAHLLTGEEPCQELVPVQGEDDGAPAPPGYIQSTG